MVTAFLWMCLLTFIAPGQEPQDRYFKEDHLSGADYIRLSAVSRSRDEGSGSLSFRDMADTSSLIPIHGLGHEDAASVLLLQERRILFSCSG